MASGGDRYIGKKIGGSYHIIAKIDSGGYGSVYKAQHIVFNNNPLVAIKIMRVQIASDEDREDFYQEARLLKALAHPHILPILDAGFQDDVPYIIMEYAAGGSLKNRIKQQAGQPFPLDEALTILTQIGAALQYAHQQPKAVVHCDLKPDNILFNAQGEALLADFGMATILSSGSNKTGKGGTPAYMAPEQFEGWVSPRSDQYALGCIAYELLTGHDVFDTEGKRLEVIQYRYLHAQVMPTEPKQHNPHLSDALSQAILTALAKERTARYAEISDFIAALSPQKTASQWLAEGNALYNGHHYREAIHAYEEAIRLRPNFTEAYVNKGTALRGLGSNEEALRAFEESIHLQPDDADAHYNKGNVLRNLQRNAEAVQAYDEALRLKPDFVQAYINKGNALATLGQYERAVKTYREAIQLSSNNALVHYNLGNALLMLGKYNEAIKAFETAIHFKSDYASAYYKKGNALAQIGRNNEAQQAYKRAKELGYKE